jgi:hypothetical protein
VFARLVSIFLSASCAVLPGSAFALSIETISGPHLVFRWETQKCESNDIPDNPLRAFRDNEGRVVAFDSHYDVRRFVGQSLTEIRRDCHVSRKSALLPEAEKFDDHLWITSTWTEDGKTIYALGHNEYQANLHPEKCIFKEYVKCWYNTVVPLISHDSGLTFAKIANAKPVASLNSRSEENQGSPRGFFEPTNMIALGEYVYTFIRTTGDHDQKRGNCLFRSWRENLGQLWEHWNGTGWSISSHDPYVDPPIQPCQPLANLPSVSSVVWYAAANKFIAIGALPGGKDQGSVAFNTSADLLNWSSPTAFLFVPTGFSRDKCAEYTYSYPSLISATSSSRNFEDVSDDAIVFMTRQRKNGCEGSLDRDLVYFRVKISN